MKLDEAPAYCDDCPLARGLKAPLCTLSKEFSIPRAAGVERCE